MNSMPSNQQSGTGEFAGISCQEITFIGRVVEDPIYANEYAFLKLSTYIREKTANAQWADVKQSVPLIFDDENKINNLVKKYIQKDRTLYVKTEYKTWGQANENHHGFFVKSVKLGPKGTSIQNTQNNVEYAGMSCQDMTFIGKVVDDPAYVNEYAFLRLRTFIREKEVNMQWTDVPQDIPLIVDDPNKIDNLIRKYIQKDRTLYVKAEYKTWGPENENNHGFFVRSIKLGPPRGNNQSDNVNSGLLRNIPR